MSKIDERIVAMKFKADQFQQGVKTTLSSLDNLRQKLNLTGATKGLENINAASKNVSLDTVSSGVDGISAKFTAMGVVGVTALATIANKAVNVGLQLAKSFTVDPIQAGLSEYELKMGSIQTILANTSKHGTKLNDVTKALDELNTYSDQTIYSFADMTKNVGLFTNAGIKVEDATAMIKGFSNEAAASGTNAEQAANAAYQLSQAMSAGEIRLMDWKSLTNAGMGGANMKSGIIDIANAMGTLSKAGVDADEVTNHFNGSLEKGWMTADVMQNYLKIQAGELTDQQMKALGLTDKQITAFKAQAITAQDAATKVKTFTQLMGTLKETAGSGWAKTFELVIGNFEEAKTLWTGINKTFSGMLDASADKRNWAMGEWKKAGGRKALIDGISNAFKALMSVLKPIKEAFNQFFPTATGLQLNHYTVAFKRFTEKLILGKETADRLKRTFAGVFAIFRVVAEVVIGIVRVFGSLFSTVGTGTGGILSFTAVVGDVVVWISHLLTKGGGLKKFFDILTNVIGFVLTPLRYLINLLMAVFEALYRGVVKLGQKAIGPLGKFFTLLSTGVVNLINWLRTLIDKALIPITAFIGRLSDAFSIFFKSLSGGSAIGTLSVYFKLIGEAFTTLMKGDFSGFMEKIKKSFSFRNVFDAIKYDFEKAMTVLRSSISEFASGFVSDFMGTIANIFANVSNFFAGLGPRISEMSTVFAPFMFIVMNISDAFQKLKDKFNSFTTPKIDTSSVKNVSSEFKAATAELSIMDKVGSRVSQIWNGVVNAFTNMKAFFAPIISDIREIFTNIKTKIMEFIKGMSFNEGVALINTGFFIALYIMLRKFLGSMKGVFDSASGMLDSIGDAFTQLGKALKTLQQDAKANIILKIGIAVGILAASVWVLSRIKPDDMKTALIAMSILFIELALMMAVLAKVDFNSSVTKTGIAMILLAVAIRILATAVKEMSGMSMEELQKGLIGVGVLLVTLALFAKFAQAGQGGFSSGAGLVLLAVAIKLLVGSVSDLGNMDTGILIKGITALGVMLVLLAGIVVFFNNTKGIVQAAAGMLILAFALMALAIAIRIYSAFDHETFVEGLKKIAITLGVLAIAMWAMPQNIPIIAVSLVILAHALLILAGVIKFLGSMSLEELSKGLLAIGVVLAIIVLAVLALSKIKDGWALLLILAAALMTISKALVVFAAAMFILGKLSWTQMAIGLAAIGGVMAILVIGCYALRPVIGILIMFAATMKTLAIALIITGVGLLAVAVGLTALTAIGVSGFAVITAGLMGLLPLIPLLAQQLGLGMIAFAKVMQEAGPPLLGAFTVFLNALFQAIIDSTPKFIEACIVLIGGLLVAIIQSTPKLIEALLVLIGGFLQLIIDLTPKFVEALLVLIGGFLQLIIDITPKIVEAVVVMIGGILQAVRELVPDVVETFLVLLGGILTAIVEGVPMIVGAFVQMLTDTMTAITAKLPDYIAAGADMIEAFLQGIAKELPRLITAAVDVITAFLDGIGDNIDDIIQAGFDLVIDFIDGLANAIDNNAERLGRAGGNLILSLVQGMRDGLGAAVRVLANETGGVIGALLNAAANALGAHSPSTKFFEFGMWADIGLANGMNKFSGLVSNASADVGHTAIDAMRKSISGISEIIASDMDMQPTIRPVLDLSDIKQNASLIDGMLTSSPLSLATTYGKASDVAAAYRTSQTLKTTSTEGTSAKVGEKIEFTQNNYSPKALSSIEIYRQTKNQISAAKGALK